MTNLSNNKKIQNPLVPVNSQTSSLTDILSGGLTSVRKMISHPLNSLLSPVPPAKSEK